MVLHILFQIFCCLSISIAAAAAAANEMKSECETKCGNLSIPYPFGIQHLSCSRNQFFNLTCNHSLTPPMLLWGSIEVLGISLLGQMTVTSYIGFDCYYQNGSSSSTFEYWMNLWENGPFTFSNTRNKFTAVGCDTQAYIKGSWGKNFTTGCISYCPYKDNVINGSCAGIGCCQSSIPPGVKNFRLSLTSFNNHTEVWNFNPCSYAVLVDQDHFNFTLSDLEGTKFGDINKTVPVVIDWVAGNETCKEAKLKKETYACLSENSQCYNSRDGLGYSCNCSSGYQGNPYIKGGCHDIDECKDQRNYPCKGNGICTNTEGNYSCTCPKGTHGDPYKDGDGCRKNSKEFPVLKVFLGFGLSLLFLFIGSTCAYWAWRKREIIKLKEKFFRQNGGLLLQDKLSSRKNKSFKIFTAKELEIATKNYSDSMIVGKGGFGIVYKGILPNNNIVAIKKSKIVDASQIEPFINEVDILSQVDHRNVVKLLGCCLEDQVPLLVYEFVSNGTLYSHIHETGRKGSISFQDRLRIATEIAEALAYLHSASTPIIHRDVKSSNILLDDNLTAKVSDFGASRLVHIDQTQITTLVQGTPGYLDPEYLQTGQLATKIDVYSFGVVLVELLTAEKAVCFRRSEKERNLTMHFTSTMKENRLLQVLHDPVLVEGQEAQLIAIAQLAKRSLKLEGDERPTMKEVVVELQGLRGFQDHPWVNNNVEETGSLLGGPSQGSTGEARGQYSLENRFLSNLEDESEAFPLAFSS